MHFGKYVSKLPARSMCKRLFKLKMEHSFSAERLVSVHQSVGYYISRGHDLESFVYC